MDNPKCTEASAFKTVQVPPNLLSPSLNFCLLDLHSPSLIWLGLRLVLEFNLGFVALMSHLIFLNNYVLENVPQKVDFVSLFDLTLVCVLVIVSFLI